MRKPPTVAEAVARAGIERQESRGAHFREDFPAKSDAYATFNIVIEKDAGGGMRLRREPLKPMPPELQQVVEENK